MATFELITEHGKAVAALLPRQVMLAGQLGVIYAMLSPQACLSVELANRWNVYAVACDPDRARAQLRRIPMTKPKNTIKLSFQ